MNNHSIDTECPICMVIVRYGTCPNCGYELDDNELLLLVQFN
jgi:hypothetical protein